MASVVLRSAGAAVGNAFMPGIGGALFGTLAGSLGGMIDSKLGLGTTVTGPRLENLSVQDSRYGAGIPIIYGNARVAGNVIWSTDLIETQHNTSVGGKGGGSSGVSETTYTYSTHCAVGICAGPIAAINTIWADSTIIYQSGIWSSGIFDNVTIYTGNAGQMPDAFMQSILGAGNVPGYQNLAYIVFDNLQLSNFGNRLPNLTFEIGAASVTTNPVMLGSVDAGISQRAATIQSGTMMPLVLQASGADTKTILVGGYVTTGSTSVFKAEIYDVTENTPVQINSISSASFAASSIADTSWALSPDGRFVALYALTSTNPSHFFVLYDTQTSSFGAIYSVNLTIPATIKQIAWVDAQHFVVDDVVGGIRGLHSFARAGSGIIDLGFTAVWGNSTTIKPFYGAQFTPYAGGLLAYGWVTTSPNILTLQARSVIWRNNALSLGAAYTVLASLALGTGSSPHAHFVQTASAEYTLVYGDAEDYRMVSFEPTASSASITRPWQIFTISFITGTTQFPVFYGDRLLMAQRPAFGNNYLISEVTLGSGSFTLSVDSAVVTGVASEIDFCAARLDDARLLLMGSGGIGYDIGQLCIIERNANGSIAAILADILNRAGYAAGDYDVSALSTCLIQGYVLQDPMSARGAIEPLQAFTPFDLVETNAQLLAVLRGGNAIATVPSTEWRAATDSQTPPPALEITRAQEMDLPREVDVDVIDPSRNFEVNTQRARRIATSARSVQKFALPVVCDADTAKQIAEARLYTAWAERDLVKLSLSRAWLALDPSDVIDLSNGNLLRIASVTQSGGLLQLEGFYSYGVSLNSAASADGGQAVIVTTNLPVPSILYMLDVPLLQNSDDQPGVYVAVTGMSGWKGASVMRSSDGVTYNTITSLSVAATSGIAASVLANGSALYPDNANTVNVQVAQGTLFSCSWIDLTNGANAALLGTEIIQFQTATVIGPGLYTLGNLLRGRRGTEAATGTHVLGENFVLLQSGAVDFVPDILSDRNKTYDFRALTGGQNLGDTQDVVFTYGMKTICPFSPVNIKGMRSLGITGDLTLTWNRRARLNAEWVDYIDVPLDEPQELYEVDIMNGAAIIRAFTGLTAPTVIYTAAEQTTDWGGAIPTTFTVNIYQTSSRYGNGNAGTAII